MYHWASHLHRQGLWWPRRTRQILLRYHQQTTSNDCDRRRQTKLTPIECPWCCLLPAKRQACHIWTPNLLLNLEVWDSINNVTNHWNTNCHYCDVQWIENYICQMPASPQHVIGIPKLCLCNDNKMGVPSTNCPKKPNSDAKESNHSEGYATNI